MPKVSTLLEIALLFHSEVFLRRMKIHSRICKILDWQGASVRQIEEIKNKS